MKKQLILIVGIWALIGVADVIATDVSGENEPGPSIFAVVAPLIVVAGGLGAYAIKRRREAHTRSSEHDSVERSLAERARSATMIDGLILGLAAGAIALFAHGLPAALWIFVAVACTVIDFWVRYAVLLRQARSES
ncbi:MAG: hypothetical protein HIU88_07465 [Acidobacteria bacterium]|nr:hypothetical protein [Acidobacteriota bacterium]